MLKQLKPFVLSGSLILLLVLLVLLGSQPWNGVHPVAAQNGTTTFVRHTATPFPANFRPTPSATPGLRPGAGGGCGRASELVAVSKDNQTVAFSFSDGTNSDGVFIPPSNRLAVFSLNDPRSVYMLPGQLDRV